MEKTTMSTSSTSENNVPQRTLTPLKAIRLKCLDCSGDSADEVRKYVIPDCPLYPFRLGKNPFRKPPSEKQRAASRANMLNLLEAQRAK